MAIGAIRAKLFLNIISHYIYLNFKQKKKICLKLDSAHTTFLFF
jgi:hypothetical protein